MTLIYNNSNKGEIMSNEEDKFKRSRRILKDDNAISKQLKIAKSNSAIGKMIDEPHRMAKHHAMWPPAIHNKCPANVRSINISFISDKVKCVSSTL